MAEKNLSRRGFLKAAGLGLAGIFLVPRINALAGGPNTARRLGEGMGQVDQPARLESLGLPGQWPETAASAATLFGGKQEYWRRDLYVDPATNEAKWGGTWVMDAYSLKVPFKSDGKYTDASGKPLSENEIFDFSKNIDKVDVNFGPYAQNYQAHGTAWDGEQYWAGYGTALFDDVVQAVVRPIVIECPVGQNEQEVLAAYQDEAWKRTAQEFSKFLFNDPNADKIIAGLWSQEKQDFKLVQGKGWNKSS